MQINFIDFITLKNIGLILLILMLLVILIKINKDKRDENKRDENVDQNGLEDEEIKKNQDSDELIDKNQDSDELIDKMIARMNDFPEDKILVSNNENDKFISDALQKDFKINNELKNTTYFDEDTITKISEKIDKKMGSDIMPYIRRVDDDGKILLDMEAVMFITKKHEPLITPSGSIKVINILSKEDELLLSIKEGKPIFFLTKEKTLEIITKDMVEKIIISKSDIDAVEELSKALKVIENYKKLEKLLNQNCVDAQDKIFNLEQELKENGKLILKKDAQLELFINSGSKFISVTKKEIGTEESIHEKKDVSLGNNKFKKSEEVKELIPSISNNNTNEEVEELIPSISNNNTNEEVEELTPSINNEVEVEKKKKLNENNLKKIIIELLSNDYLLSDKLILNKSTRAEELVFVSARHEKTKKNYKFDYVEKNLINYIEKYLNKNNYEANEKDKNDVLIKLKSYESSEYYFTCSNDRLVYKTKIITINFDKEELYGVKFVARYSEVFTLKDIEIKIRNETTNAKIKLWQTRETTIMNKNFINI